MSVTVSDEDPDQPPNALPEDPTRRITIDVELTCGRWHEAAADPVALCRGAALAALAAAGLDRHDVAIEIGVRLTGDEEQRALNARHRGVDRTTNVLSFPAAGCVAGEAPRAPAAGAPVLLGDVVVAWETVRDEAAAQRKSIADHLRHLVIHGVLHLAGYDHEADAEAEAMERLETDALATLGVADPYATVETGTLPGKWR